MLPPCRCLPRLAACRSRDAAAAAAAAAGWLPNTRVQVLYCKKIGEKSSGTMFAPSTRPVHCSHEAPAGGSMERCRRVMRAAAECCLVGLGSEAAWRRRPLRHCCCRRCCCFDDIRRGSAAAACLLQLLSLLVLLPVFLLLRAQSYLSDEAARPSASELPVSVFVLQQLYTAFVVFAVLLFVACTVALAAMFHWWSKDQTVGSRRRCAKSPLVLARLLRVGAYLFFVALFLVSVHARHVCFTVSEQTERGARSLACACAVNSTWQKALLPPHQGTCAPKRYLQCTGTPVGGGAGGARCQACGLDVALFYQSDGTHGQGTATVRRSGGGHAYNATIGETVTGYTHRACTAAACRALGPGCRAREHECPASQADYRHSLEAAAGHPLQYLSAWTDAKHGSDECRYDSQGHLLSLRFERARGGADGGADDESAAQVDAFVQAGVLRLVPDDDGDGDGGAPPSAEAEMYAAGAAGQQRTIPLEKLELILSGDIRGGSNWTGLLGQSHELLAWASNQSSTHNRTGGAAGLGGVRLNLCKLQVEELLLRVASARLRCARFIRGWAVLFCAVGCVGCWHFGRVFFALALETEGGRGDPTTEGGATAAASPPPPSSLDEMAALRHVQLEALDRREDSEPEAPALPSRDFDAAEADGVRATDRIQAAGLRAVDGEDGPPAVLLPRPAHERP
jgi:hypothetical protein